MSRIGVFVCWCGENIGRTVDCPRVAEAARRMPGVAHAADYKYMCSDPGQQMIIQAIAEHRLTGLVIASCSPRMHEPTFRKAAARAGLNPYLCEMANIREHCSWVHEDRAVATAKAIELVRVIVEKVRHNEALQAVSVPITDRALVIGGGIAGIQAALDIADAGHDVVLVERSPSIGGHMSQLSETFPTLDCSQCILTPKMVEVAQHPRIRLLTCSEVDGVNGYVGNFEVTIRRKARYVRLDRCTGCGACWNECPVKKIPSEFDEGLGLRTAVYVPFPQAVPNKPVIDTENCLRHKDARRKGIPVSESKVCGKCEAICPIPGKAINFADADELETIKVGAIVVATGFQTLPAAAIPEYGAGRFKDVLTGLQFERLASASGPTSGEIRRPSDGQPVERLAVIACVGSRDPAKGCAYCSKICCMYIAKHAMLFRHKNHHGAAHVFYMDIRAGGKDYDEFVRRAIEEDGVDYVRGRVSRIFERGGKLVLFGSDTLVGEKVELEVDMVVLASAMVPQPGVQALAQMLGVAYNQSGWLTEAHPKLRPVETAAAGVFLAGTCQGPRDIPETVAQAGGAASKVIGLLSRETLDREPIVARVDERTCDYCTACIKTCPVKAIGTKELKNRQGVLLRRVAEVNPGLCIGCGTCVAACRPKAIDLAGFTDAQLFAEMRALGDFINPAPTGADQGAEQPSCAGCGDGCSCQEKSEKHG